MNHVDDAVIFIARCCHIEYYTNSYRTNSKRFVIRSSLYNQKYINFGGKCVRHIDVLLRYASDLINMVRLVQFYSKLHYLCAFISEINQISLALCENIFTI
jgi:hypothetical protein